MTAWARSRRLSLARMWLTWVLVVCSEMVRVWLISVLESPRAMSRSISCSRAVRGPSVVGGRQLAGEVGDEPAGDRWGGAAAGQSLPLAYCRLDLERLAAVTATHAPRVAIVDTRNTDADPDAESRSRWGFLK